MLAPRLSACVRSVLGTGCVWNLPWGLRCPLGGHRSMHLTVVPLGGHYCQNAGGRQVPCRVLPTATCAIRWRRMGIHSLVLPMLTIGARLRLGLDAHSSSSFSAGSQSRSPFVPLGATVHCSSAPGFQLGFIGPCEPGKRPPVPAHSKHRLCDMHARPSALLSSRRARLFLVLS